MDVKVGSSIRFSFAAAAAALLLAGCGGGTKTGGGQGTPGSVSGLVAPTVKVGTIKAYRLDAQLKRILPEIGSGTSGNDGTFLVSLVPYNGALEVAVTGGTYREPASALAGGVTSSLAANEWSAIILGYKSGSGASVTVSPVSSFAAAFARWHMKNDVSGQPAEVAYGYALDRVKNHFGGVGIDWLTVQPANMATVAGSGYSDPAVTAASLLGALSQQAADMGSGATPPQALGSAFTSADFIAQALGDVAANGALDGAATAGTITFLGRPLSGNTMRRDLALALLRFMQNPLYNATQAASADVRTTANNIAGRSDAYLFCSGGVETTACAPTGLGAVKPDVVFVEALSAMPVVRLPPEAMKPGQLPIAVVATDHSTAGIMKVEYELDGTGPRTVLQQFSSGPDVGKWYITLPTLSGKHTLRVYATDNLNQVSDAPATAVVYFDGTLPQVQSSVAVDSFTSEQGLRARVNADGTAMFPAQYDLAPGATPGFSRGGNVYRSAARVMAVPAGVNELLAAATNVQNIPALRYDIAYNADTDSRIVSVTAAVTVTQGPSSTVVSDLPLLAAPAAVGAYTVPFVLPLTSATVPDLAVITGPATVSVVVTMTDAAGNTNTDSGNAFSFTLTLLAPPLVVRQDTAWADGRDPSSAYQYPANSTAYFTTWNATAAAFVGGQVRVARYIIENPSSVPAAVAVSGTLTSSVRGASAPYDIGTPAPNGIGSASNPTYNWGTYMTAESNPQTYGAGGGYWTTSAIAGCTNPYQQIDPGCDPMMTTCDLAWVSNPPAVCGPGAEILPWARSVHRQATDTYSHVVDGHTLYRNWGYWVPGAAGDGGAAQCTPGAWISAASTQPTPETFCPKGQVIRHLNGDTAARFSCQRADYFTAPAVATHEFAIAAAGVSAWQSPQVNGAERNAAVGVGGSSLVPAATTAPGQIVIYVSRPSSAAAPSNLSFGGVTGTGRMEKLVSYWWKDPGVMNLSFLWWRQSVSNPTLHFCNNTVLQERLELAAFATMDEVLDGSFSLTARPSTASGLLGTSAPVTTVTFAKTAVGSR